MKVNQMEAAAVFQVTIPLGDLLDRYNEARLMRNARRRTKSEAAAREIAAWKLSEMIQDKVEASEVAKWVWAQDGKATLCRKFPYLNEARVICHDAPTAMLFKLTFCGT